MCAGGGWDSIYENDQSDKVLNKEKQQELFKYSSIVTGAQWPPANQPKSPCPTLKVGYEPAGFNHSCSSDGG